MTELIEGLPDDCKILNLTLFQNYLMILTDDGPYTAEIGKVEKMQPVVPAEGKRE